MANKTHNINIDIALWSSKDNARFWKKVNQRPDGCWIWTDYTKHSGYGSFWYKNICYRAHVVSYLLHGGHIPDGYVIHHECGNKACVNPAHLCAVTQRHNLHADDTLARRNAVKTHCSEGHPYTPDNTYLHTNKKGITRRHCMTCRRIRAQQRYVRLQQKQLLICTDHNVTSSL